MKRFRLIGYVLSILFVAAGLYLRNNSADSAIHSFGSLLGAAPGESSLGGVLVKSETGLILEIVGSGMFLLTYAFDLFAESRKNNAMS